MHGQDRRMRQSGLPGNVCRVALKLGPGLDTDLLRQRLQVEYDDADRFLKIHFGGECPYDTSIKRNLGYLNELLAKDDLSLLRRSPQRIIDGKR